MITFLLPEYGPSTRVRVKLLSFLGFCGYETITFNTLMQRTGTNEEELCTNFPTGR